MIAAFQEANPDIAVRYEEMQTIDIYEGRRRDGCRRADGRFRLLVVDGPAGQARQ
jgi:hypothetical protein